jgi:hypothetical protein
MGTQRRVIAPCIEMYTHRRTVVRILPNMLALQLCELAWRRGRGRFAGAVLVATALLIAACAPQSGGASVGGTKSATDQATPMTTVAHTPTVTPNPSSGSGQMIVLLPGASHYKPSDIIAVTIRNSTGKTAYAEANFTDCSVILVERFVASSWQPVNSCANGYPHPAVTQIKPGTEAVVQMSPTSASSDEQANATSDWPMGTYRASLTYTSSLSAAFGAGTTSFSTTFDVG